MFGKQLFFGVKRTAVFGISVVLFISIAGCQVPAPPVQVPDVVGQPQAAAETAFIGAGLVLGTVTESFSTTVAAGYVISQTPTAVTQVASGTPVTLEVSKGPDLRTVPDVTGQTQAAAETAIVGVGLVVGTVTESFSSTVAAGGVISQNPSAAAQVAPGTAVALEVSKGPDLRTVPDVTGQTQAAAETAITGVGLVLGAVTESFNSTVAAGNVISQTPTAGTQVAPVTAVALEVSKGPDPRTVPDVAGQTEAAAVTAITDAGLVLGTVTESVSDTVAEGAVISQTPTAGTEILAGNAVSLVVSVGPVRVVPDVMGMSVPEASTALLEAGLAVGTETDSFSNLVEARKILRQIPLPGTLLDSEFVVNLVVSKGADLRTVPNLAGVTEAAARTSIMAVGLAVGAVTEKRSNTVTEGHIFGQAPVAGTAAAPSSPVDLVVARNFDTVVMPNLVGKTASDAKTALVNAGLPLDTTLEEFSDTVAKGRVIAQSPAPDLVMPADTTAAIITLSMGPVDGGGDGTPVLHPALGKIAEICAVSDPAFVYAIDQDNQALYKISIPARGIVQSFNLPEPNPLAMAYSAPDNTLYIVSQDSANVSVWNVTTQSCTTHTCTASAIDIAVDPIHRRIHVLCSGGVFNILNLDTGAVLATQNFAPPFFPDTMTIDPVRQKLFSAVGNFAPTHMYRYSVAGDTVTFEQAGDTECSGRAIEISPDGQHLLYPTGCGNGSGPNIQDYNPLDLTRFSGAWNVGTYPAGGKWSPDSQVFLGTNGDPYDNYLYVMSASNYKLHRKLAFPNCSDYARFAPNADGSVVVGFSYDNYYQNAHALYFFDDVLPSLPSAQDAPIAIGTISEITAVSDPAYVYAIDQDQQALYKIDVDAEKIVKRFDLPFTQPIAMAYSGADSALYIVSRFSGVVVVWDLAAETYHTFAFSDRAHGSDIAVDGDHRRVYVQDTKGTLYILNADSGAVIAAQGSLPGDSFALDPEGQKIIATTSHVSPATGCRYSVAGDVVSLEQSVRMESGSEDFIAISPDRQRVVCGQPFQSFNTWDLGDQVGVLDAAGQGAFSPDGGVFLGLAGDNTLAMMGAVNGQLYRTLDFPNSNDYARVAVTSDSSAAVGYSYSRYYDDARALYFFHNVRQPAPDAPDEPFSIGRLAEITAVSDPAFVYAIDRDKQALYKIDVNGQRITKRYGLPFQQPVAMAYSAPDNALYILSRFSGDVVVWDVAAESFKIFPLATNADGLGVQVDPARRRIYELGDEDIFFILDMDTGALIDAEPFPGTGCNAMALDPVHQKLFAVEGAFSPSGLFRFSVAGDRVAYEQYVQSGAFGDSLAVSPDGLHLVFPTGSGNGEPLYVMYDYSTLDLTSLFGYWNVGTYPNFARWSVDGGILYASNGNPYDNFLYVMDAASHQQIRKLAFPNSTGYVRFSPNGDGSVVVGFSCDPSYGNDRALSFFYDVQPPSWLKRR